MSEYKYLHDLHFSKTPMERLHLPEFGRVVWDHQQQKIDDITGHIKTLKALHEEGNLTMGDVMMFLKGVEGVLE